MKGALPCCLSCSLHSFTSFSASVGRVACAQIENKLNCNNVQAQQEEQQQQEVAKEDADGEREQVEEQQQQLCWDYVQSVFD